MLIIFRNSAQVANERTRPFDRLSHNHPILDISFNQAIAVTSWIVRINLHRIRARGSTWRAWSFRSPEQIFRQLRWSVTLGTRGFFFLASGRMLQQILKTWRKPETGHEKGSGSQGSDQHNTNYYIFSDMEIRNCKSINHKVHSGCNL